MKKVALKPCPFKHPKKFGKKQDLDVLHSGIGIFVYVRCNICGGEGSRTRSEYWAIKKWNERAGGR